MSGPPKGEEFWEKVAYRAEKLTLEVKKALGVEDKSQDLPQKSEAYWIDEYLSWLPHRKLHVDRTKVNVQNAATRLVKNIVGKGDKNDTRQLKDLINFFILDSPDFLDRSEEDLLFKHTNKPGEVQVYDVSNEIFEEVRDFQLEDKTEHVWGLGELSGSRFLNWCQDESMERDVRAYLGLLSIALLTSGTSAGELKLSYLIQVRTLKIAKELAMQTPPTSFRIDPFIGLRMKTMLNEDHLMFVQLLRSSLEICQSDRKPSKATEIFDWKILRSYFGYSEFRMVFYLGYLFEDDEDLSEFVKDVEQTKDEKIIEQARNYQQVMKYISTDDEVTNLVPFVKVQTFKFWKYSFLFSRRFFSSLIDHNNWELVSVVVGMIGSVERSYSSFPGTNTLYFKYQEIGKELFEKHLARKGGSDRDAKVAEILQRLTGNMEVATNKQKTPPTPAN